MKSKLKFTALATVTVELTRSEIIAIDLMASGKDMTNQVTKTDLVRIIFVLCKDLDWIEEEEEDLVVPASAETDDSTVKYQTHHFPNPSNCNISDEHIGDNSGHEIEPITATDDPGVPVNITLSWQMIRWCMKIERNLKKIIVTLILLDEDIQLFNV